MFKHGDQVKCAPGTKSCIGQDLSNQIGTFKGSSSQQGLVEIYIGGSIRFVPESALTLYVSQTQTLVLKTFKTGDKVRYLGGCKNWDQGTLSLKPTPVGSVFTVGKVDNGYVHPDRDRPELGLYACSCANSKYFELVSESEPTAKPGQFDCKCALMDLLKDGCQCGSIERFRGGLAL